MKGKKIIILVVIILILAIAIFLIFFNRNTAKTLKIGNNTSSQEIVDYILNIRSYEAKIEVEIKSNKNENKYIIKQNYKGEEDNFQEILEPSNIAGVKIIKNGKTLRLENTDLKLTSIFENYEYISENCLDLSSFIEDYKNSEKSKWEEKNDSIIMQTSSQEKTMRQKTLYISRETGKPTKMEIENTNQKTAIYILYKEVNVNS